MTPDRHARIKEVFLGACEQPPEKRGDYLAGICGQDVELRREVDQLLAHHLAEPPKPADSPTSHSKNKLTQPLPPERPQTFDPSALTAGEIVVDRYRIVALLGEGAMGIVYRADDLRLNQLVALKFLSAEHAHNPAWLRRFKSEVNLARQIAHPNICRIYDLGECDGVPFISMEYVDGEDLSSLLHRVGRLSDARAVDIASQICVGLAAAHIHGIIHRDLKPSNVMLDSRGRVRITDFGLSSVIGGVDRREIRAGTPRYMAPEQIAGIEVTQKSDIYSLGLVLYEIFVGRPAFEADNVLEYACLHGTVEPAIPSSIVPEIDPKVEAVILACLHKNPAERPESALNVAAALPGGDILAAALAAGEIPTREMLADAASTGSVSPSAMRKVAGVFFLLVIVALILGRNNHPLTRGGEPKPPEALLQQAQDMVQLAHPGRTRVDSAWQYLPAREADDFEDIKAVSGVRFHLAVPGENALLFVYQESYDQPIGSRGSKLPFVVTDQELLEFDPTPDGMITTILDMQGRLLFFESREIPPSAQSVPAGGFDQSLLLKAAGLGNASVNPAQPDLVLQDPADQHLGFEITGSADYSSRPARVELATMKGLLRYFIVLSDSPVRQLTRVQIDRGRRAFMGLLRNSVLVVLLMTAIPVAWLNLRKRGDLVGAYRLGCFILSVRLLADLLKIRYMGEFSEQVERISLSVVAALCEGMIIGLFYLALETYVRRWWPRTLGGWSRVITGRLRDRFLARDVLIGCTVGMGWALLGFLDRMLPEWAGWQTREQLRVASESLELHGARFAIAGVLDLIRNDIYAASLVLLLLVLGVWLTGSRRWLAILGTWIIGSVMYAPSATHPVTAWTIFAIGVVGVAIYVLIRFGLVSVVIGLVVAGLWDAFPISLDFAAWYTGYTLFVVFISLCLAGWGFMHAIRPSEPNPHKPVAA